MALRLYNTLTGQKEPFIPQVPGKAGMYVCGVTVYDYCHIGHARAGIVFDVIYRYLQYAGYDVTFVRNYTDIDDKIINRANQEGTDYRTIADRYIAAFDEDMGRLGLAKPTIEPKATDHIDDIIAIIQRLIANGHAYEAAGDVYFAVETFGDYLKLSKRNLEICRPGPGWRWTNASRTRWILPSGKAPNRVSPGGSHPGARAGPAGISNAQP